LELSIRALARQKRATGEPVARPDRIKPCKCPICRSKRHWRITAAVVAVGAVLLFSLNEADWVGHAQIPLEFVVLDSTTGHPIEGGSLRLLLEDDPVYEATTGSDGRARFVGQFMTGGRSSILRRTRVVNYNLMVAITADGYQALSVGLYELTKESRYHSDPYPPTIVIQLAPASPRM